jgi:hypothetical protein
MASSGQRETLNSTGFEENHHRSHTNMAQGRMPRAAHQLASEYDAHAEPGAYSSSPCVDDRTAYTSPPSIKVPESASSLRELPDFMSECSRQHAYADIIACAPEVPDNSIPALRCSDQAQGHFDSRQNNARTEMSNHRGHDFRGPRYGEDITASTSVFPSVIKRPNPLVSHRETGSEHHFACPVDAHNTQKFGLEASELSLRACSRTNQSGFPDIVTLRLVKIDIARYLRWRREGQ